MYVYVYHIFFRHSSIDGYSNWVNIFSIVSNAAMNMAGGDALWHTDSIPLDIFLEVELLDHVIILILIFWGTSILFSKMAILIYIPTHSIQGPLL
jgi:hypothetical protein